MQAQTKKDNKFVAGLKRFASSDEMSALVPLLIVAAIMAILGFFQKSAWGWFGDNFIGLLANFPFIGLTALAAAYPLMTGKVDISTGRLVGFAGMVCATASVDWGWNPVLSILLALALTLVFGVINGFLVIKLNVVDFIATMGTLYISGGCRYIMFDGVKLNINEQTNAAMTNLANWFSDANEARWLGLPKTFWVALVIFIISYIIVKKTVFGRQLLAVGDNREVAALAGIPVERYSIIAYIICSFICGIVGVMYTLNTKCGDPAIGDGWEFRAIAACVVGGTSLAGGKCSPISVFIGCFLVMAVENAILFFPEYVPSTMTFAIRGAIMALAVLYDMVRQNRKIKA